MKKYNVTVNGTVYEVEIEEVEAFSGAPAAPKAAQVTKEAPSPAAKPAPKAETQPAPTAPKAVPAGANAVKAPMPGTIVKVNVKEGQKVTKGTLVAVLEAMKMENDILAPTDGVIASINVSSGAAVAADDVIVTIA